MPTLSLLLLTLAAGAAPADDSAKPIPVVRDPLKLFSKTAADDASAAIRELTNRYHLGLFIDTTDQMPPESAEERRAWWKTRARNRSLNGWAMGRADDLREKGAYRDGVYLVVIDAGPGKRDVRVVAWPAQHGADSEISWVKRDRLRKLMVQGLQEALREKDTARQQESRDRALLNVIETYRYQLKQIREPDPSPLGTTPALIIVGALFGAWLVLSIVRWRVTQRVRPTDPEPVKIYQPAMMGTLFGVPAAFWVNDELFRVIPPEVPPARPGEADNFTLPPAPTFPPEPSAPAGEFTMPPEASGPPQP